jgi:predicted nuclease with TOPRIM domain
MAAEMPDIARELLQRAEGMEREVAAAKEELMRRMHGEHGGPKSGPPEEAEALRNENRKLQNELRELRGLVEKLKTEGGR